MTEVLGVGSFDAPSTSFPCGGLLEVLSFFLALKIGIIGSNQHIVVGFGIIVVQEHGIKQMKLRNKASRSNDQDGKNSHARPERDLGHHIRTQAQHACPSINKKHGLALVKATLNKTMVNVALIGLPDAHMRALATNNSREGIDNRNARDEQRDNNSGQARNACDV